MSNYDHYSHEYRAVNSPYKYGGMENIEKPRSWFPRHPARLMDFVSVMFATPK